ncbi:MAG: class I tRNA ligase family protein, partial [Pseudomonadota bacterium]|nr:class I tRNA ligase family protein [Pseudomonadota bacterium]
MTRILVTSALPYINGIKHLGNLVGSQLPADAYSRVMRQRGHEVLFICATDEHGTPTELAAAKAGKTPAAFCDEMHEVQARIADGFRMSFDHFGRSSSARNHQLTQHLSGRLAEAGLIEEVSEKQVYSKADGRFLPDRYIEGECPNCGYAKARGDQCENCTKQLDPTDLINPYSAISGSRDLEVRETKHLHLRQSAMRGKLTEWIDSVRTCSTEGIEHWSDFSSIPHSGYVALMEDRRSLIERLKSLPLPHRELIHQYLAKTVAGMDQFLVKNDAWHDVGELREYCYYVAGVVGEMLTAMFTSYDRRLLPAEDELMRLAPSVGESLQLVNMIRDYKTHNERKRLYFSEAINFDDHMDQANQTIETATD